MSFQFNNNHTLSQTPARSGALYLRLSKDDEGSKESLSIANQRKYLLRYAREHQFSITKEYVDDGYSGTNFDRPAFKLLIEAVKRQEISLLLVKDLSRLGRDYLQTGQYTELFFPAHRVRLIAVGDGYDSAAPDNDLIPFRNLLNEMYARDISRKIRSALLVRMEEGSYIGNFPPYGYDLAPQEQGAFALRCLTPNPEASPVVRSLFIQAAKGACPSALARELNDAGCPSPYLHRLKKHPQLKQVQNRGRGLWSANTIIKLLHNPVYLGHLSQGKTKKLSFRSGASIPIPPEEQITVFYTHPPLTSESIFLQCQEQLASRNCRRQKKQ